MPPKPSWKRSAKTFAPAWALLVIVWLTLLVLPAGNLLTALVLTMPTLVWPFFVLPWLVAGWIRKNGRLVALAAATFALAWMLMVGAPSFGGVVATEPHDLKVMTYNVEFAYEGEERLAQTVAKLDPDVLFVQESIAPVDRLHPVEAIQRGLPHHFVAKSFDLTIFSRFPIQELAPVEVPGLPRRRWFQRAAIQVNGKTVQLMNVHFAAEHLEQYSGWAKLGRMIDVDRFRLIQSQLVTSIVPKIDGPLIVAGDMNQQPTGPGYRELRAHLRDAFALSGRGYGWTLTTHIPTKRVDYIWLGAGLECVGADVPNVDASDHRPLMTWLRLR